MTLDATICDGCADGCAVLPAALSPDACAALSRELRRRRAISQPRGDGAARLRARRVSVLRYPSAGVGGRPAQPRCIRASPRRQSLERSDAGLPRATRRTRGFLWRLCHGAGQTEPTPLLLSYGAGDYNCLHQDLYGDLVFPLQVALLLVRCPTRISSAASSCSREQRPRMQSRVEVVPLGAGDGVVFPVQRRPVRGTRGVYRVTLAPWRESSPLR